MEWTVQQVDGFCGQLDRLADQLSVSASSQMGLQPRDEQLVNEVVQTIQRVGEGVAWAYGQHHRPNLGELFAQPFVDHRTRDRLKQLLEPPAHQPQQAQLALQQRLRNKIATQILQTIHILLQATPEDSTLFCNLTAGWYLNGVVAAPFEFRENEDLLPLWMTVVREIASMLNKDNMMLFFDPTSEKPFPIYSEAMRFYHHPTAQVRTGVQAVSLEVFLKLRDENAWAEPVFQLVLTESMSFFTHLSCLLREFWYMVDMNMRSGSKRDARSALSMQNDILVYVNDVLTCEIPQLSAVVQEKLLRFAVLPILVRSALRAWPTSGADANLAPSGALTPSTAVYLLCDLLVTLKGSALLSSVALAMLQQRVPDDALQLVMNGPPRTPMQYTELSKQWGGHAAASPANFISSKGPAASDETLYSMPPVELGMLLEGRVGTAGFVQNRMFDLLDGELQTYADPRSSFDIASVGRSVGLLQAVAMLLKARKGHRELAPTLDRLAQSLCVVIAAYKRVPWPIVEAALEALQEIAQLAAAFGPQQARSLLGAPLRDRILRPVSQDLLTDLSRLPQTGGTQELWLWEFQEAWRQHLKTPQELDSEEQKKAFLDGAIPTVGGESLMGDPLRGGPEGRGRAFRVVLSTYRLWQGLSDAGAPVAPDMPGADEIEAEEANRYQPGVSVHIGKMNRVKVQVRSASPRTSFTPSEFDSLYLLPAQATLLLVRPDEQKPFWAVPVISEPLRSLRLELGDENASGLGGNSEEACRTVGLQVLAPRSPTLKKLMASTAQHLGHGRPGGPVPGDRLAMTTIGAPGGGYPGRADPMAHSVPIQAMNMASWSSAAMGGVMEPASQTPTQCPIALVLADERRRRVACKLLAQAQHAVHIRATKHVCNFLTQVNVS